MELKQAQDMSFKIIEDWNNKHNKKHDKTTVFLHLVEEVGEVAKELNHFNSNWRGNPDKEKLAEEIADVLDKIFILAKDYDIDLEQAFINKNIKLRKRFDLD